VYAVGRFLGGTADYFVSNDAGRTWVVSDLRKFAYALVDVAFLSDSIGLIGGMSPAPIDAGGATILKTNDGGRTWRTVFTSLDGRGFVWKLFPVSDRLIYAAMQSQDGVYRLAKSADGGDHWAVLVVARDRPGGPGIQAVGFASADTGWVGGFFEGMFRTVDGGATWQYVSVPDRNINRVVRVGEAMFTAGSEGILRRGRLR
jgi:photosystem II stability/assembly factor-like uncharacterized protein